MSEGSAIGQPFGSDSTDPQPQGNGQQAETGISPSDSKSGGGSQAPALDEYLALIEKERARRPAEAMLADEIVRLRSLLHGTCAAFGHLWPEKRPKRRPRNVRCSACGMHLFALNRNGNEEFTDA